MDILPFQQPEIAGISSTVYVLDISLEMLEEVEKRASKAELSNIRTIKTEEYDLKLKNQTVGFALLSNVEVFLKDYIMPQAKSYKDGELDS